MRERINVSNGFTLLELIIAVAIIAILAAIAIPSYSQFLSRAKRSEGMDALTEIMNQQQRFLTKNRTYTNNLQNLGYAANTFTTEDGNYSISATDCNGGTDATLLRRCVLLTAADQESQEGDGDITLNSRGQRTWNGLSGWEHR